MSTMQMRAQGDNRIFNPDRDVAHNFKQVAVEMARRIQDRIWPDVEQLLGEALGEEERAMAVRVFTDFILTGILPENREETMEDSLKRVGWFDKIKPESRVALMAYLGSIYFGIAYQGIRETTFNNVGPLSDVKQLVDIGTKLAEKALTVPKPEKTE